MSSLSSLQHSVNMHVQAYPCAKQPSPHYLLLWFPHSAPKRAIFSTLVARPNKLLNYRINWLRVLASSGRFKSPSILWYKSQLIKGLEAVLLLSIKGAGWEPRGSPRAWRAETKMNFILRCPPRNHTSFILLRSCIHILPLKSPNLSIITPGTTASRVSWTAIPVRAFLLEIESAKLQIRRKKSPMQNAAFKELAKSLSHMSLMRR